MAKSHARCKGGIPGHWWDDAPAPPTARPAPKGHEKLFFRCSECLTQKTYILNLKTGKGRGVYKYTDAYKNDTLAGSKAEWKLLYAANRRKKNKR